MEETFKKFKRKSIRAAKDLCYSDKVVDAIKAAKNEMEIEAILRKARIAGEYAGLYR